MKRRSIRIFAIILTALIFTVSAVSVVYALSTADAKEKIDTSKNCSLTLTYAIDDTKLEGLEIEIYLTSTVSADFRYSMTGAFSSYPVEINGIKSQTEWNEVKDTVSAYITADGIAPTAKQTTDENGTVKFTDLPVGMYYVRWTGNETVDQVEGFAPIMIALPGLGDDGKWIYDVDALPKPGIMPEPEVGEMTLTKLWKDGRGNKRPESVSVDIFRNGQLYESVELTQAYNWMYRWQTDGVYTWTAVERNVPDGYTVSIQSRDGNVIQIVNSREEDPPEPPQTGDSSNLYLWLLLTVLSGIVLVVLGSYRKKEHEE